MVRKYILDLLQNKNSVMFITAMIFIIGVMSYFNDCAIVSGLLISLLLIIFLLKNIISIKYAILWIFIFYIGFFNANFRTASFDNLSKLAPVKGDFTGQIVSIPNSNNSEKTKFFFKVNKFNENDLSGKTLITVSSEDGDFSIFDIGKTFKISGAKLRIPIEATNPSQFDYAKYLRNFNTYSVIYAEKADFSEINTKMTPKWQFMYNLNKIRNKIINIHSQYLKSPNLEILGGVVFGDDAVAPPDYVKDSFVNSGLLHILAASGMNVAFIYTFWFFFMRRLKVPFKLSVMSGMLVVILYTLMTGLGASVVRAALMLLFVLTGKLIDRDAHSISLLSFVALLMLLYNPAYINDVGFQLSFVVTFGILTTAVIVQDKLTCIKFPFSNFIIPAVLIPIVAQIWVIPIQMFYFNSISTYSVFANISIVPFLSIVSFGGFISSILALVPLFARYICPVLDFLLNIAITAIVNISNYFSNLPDSLIQTTHPSIFQLSLYYFIVLAFTFLVKTGFHKKLFLLICSLIFVILLSTVNIPNNNFEVIAFDVKNADAFLLKTPKNKYFMIDTGKSGYNGGKSQAKYLLLKYFKDRGIKNLEGLVITHFDNDHSGGAFDLISDLKVKKVYINSFEDKSYTSSKIYKILKEKQIPTVLVTQADKIYSEDNFQITLTRANIDGKNNDNENSIISIVNHNDFVMLFTGDAGVKAFEKLKAELPSNIEVLKVGHHGGNNVVDNVMLEYLNPKVSLISTGINTFGHPTRAVLDTLRHTDIYRTDINHSIKIISKDNKYEVKTFDRSKHKYISSGKFECR